jgi:hypothetical protein
MTQLVFALRLLISTSAASDDLPIIGPCDVALEQMEAVLVARVDGVTLEEYAESHSAEMMVVATVVRRKIRLRRSSGAMKSACESNECRLRTHVCVSNLRMR